MGCQQSKAIRVRPAGAASVINDNTDDDIQCRESGTQTNRNLKKCANTDEAFECDVDEKGNKTSKIAKNKKRKSDTNKKSLGSCESLEDDRSMDSCSDRGFSATSKTSKASADSGLGDDYANVVTEFSRKEDVERVEREFGEEKKIDMEVTGVSCPTRLSAKDKARMEESLILQSLREEGLITRPRNEASGGVSFEIITNTEEMATARPPPRLAKLEKRSKKKKTLTEEEIREKLERAEKRRKKKEQEKIVKIKEMEKVDQLTSLESFAQHRKEKEEQVSQKMDQVLDNKEKRLKEIKDKIRAREKHAEEVRRRKLIALSENGEFAGSENSENADESF